MQIGVGARAFAMAGAQVAHADDATAAYWNPAGLQALPDQYSLGLMHAEYMAGAAKYDFVGFSTRLDSLSRLSLSVLRYGVDDIPDTRNLFDANGTPDYSRIQFFSAADYGFLLSFARASTQVQGLWWGANAKVLHRTVGPFASAWGFGLDVGAQYKTGRWRLGGVLRDATTTFNSWSYNTSLLQDIYAQTGNEIPERSTELTLPRLILGLARSLPMGEKFRALIALDVVTTFDGRRNALIQTDFSSIEPQLGLELAWAERIFLRGGVGQGQQIKDFDGSHSWSFTPSAGLGLRFRKVCIDYAMSNIGDIAEAPYAHIFSLNLNLNPSSTNEN